MSFAPLLLLLISVQALAANGTDWSASEQQLGRKIVAVTGKCVASLNFENRSTLGRRDSEIIENGIEDVLGRLGVRAAKTEQATCGIKISLSENVSSYVWVAEIRRGEGDRDVVLVSLPRPAAPQGTGESVPLNLRKIPLWTQSDPILDVAVLEENASPTRIAVLSPERVSLYRSQGGRWQQEQSIGIAHQRPWPRDLRGRLLPGKDHLLDVYLPGVFCSSGQGPSLNCRDSNDPWPVMGATVGGAPSSSDAAVTPVSAFFATTRNFFTGALSRPLGSISSVAKFYSAAASSSGNSGFWLFASTEGQVHLVDGRSDQVLKAQWGSDLAGIKTECGAGWQVLASGYGEGRDSVRAYEFPDRDPVPVSAAIDFPGTIVALWTEARGDSAVAVVKNQMTGSYEAFRLAIACNR